MKFCQTFTINTNLAVEPCEAKGTLAGVPCDLVMTDGLVLTGTALTLVQVPLALASCITRQTGAVVTVHQVLQCNTCVINTTPITLLYPSVKIALLLSLYTWTATDVHYDQ